MHRGNLRKLGVSAWYERKKKDVFSHWLRMHEGVGEDSRHRIGYVDIEVGS